MSDALPAFVARGKRLVVNREQLSALAHREHPICAPLAAEAVNTVLARAALRPEALVLDVGCGMGEWLIRVLEQNPSASGHGVDPSSLAIQRTRELANSRIDPRRIELATSTIVDFGPKAGAYDLVMCIGSTHAFGGLEPTLSLVPPLLRPGGIAIVGDGFWMTEPSAAALTALGCASDEFADLASTIALARDAGFFPIYAHVSSQPEWDDYEFSWAGSLFKYVNEFLEHPERAEIQEAAEKHLDGYLRGYRGVLGFVTLVLAKTPERAS